MSRRSYTIHPILLRIDLEFIKNLISDTYSLAYNEHSPCGGDKIFIVGQLAKGGFLTLDCCCEDSSEDDMDG